MVRKDTTTGWIEGRLECIIPTECKIIKPMENIFWIGYSNNERNQSIVDMEKIINSYGYLTDFKLFSDLSISITIEIEEHKINSLYTELKNKITLDKFENINSNSSNERTIFLNVVFSKGTGDLKIEVPAVPG